MVQNKIKIFVVLFFLVLLLCFTAIRYFAGKNVGGDQVHYLVMTQSLLEDGDFNLKNDYDLKRYYAYYEGPQLDLHVARQFTPESSKQYSLHNPGIPLFIAPFVKFFDYNRGSIIAMLFWTILTLILTYLWCIKVTANIRASLFATTILCISQVFISLAGYVFPNLITASLTLGALLLFFTKQKKIWHYILLGLILGVGPWFHVKTLLTFALIGFATLIQVLYNKKKLLQRVKEIAALCIVPIILLTLFEVTLHKWYGVILPSQTFAGGQLFLLPPFKALLATWFDATKGFFTNNPALLLVFIGLPVWIKTAPKQFFILACLLLPGYFLQLTFADWWGGWSPTGRYIIEGFPVVMPAIAYVFLIFKNILIKGITFILVGAQCIFSATYIFLKSPWVWVGEKNPVFVKLEQISQLSIESFMPHFSIYLQTKNGVLIVWVLGVLVLLFIGLSQRNNVRTIGSI